MGNCPICRNGKLEEGHTTVVLERDETTLVFNSVPARICEICDETFVSSAVNSDLLNKANLAVGRGVTFELLRYAV